jgi:4-alpha-glucanotransferase
MADIGRSSGILLHISSLPGKFGIGDLGKSAFDFVDFLSETGTKYWQILPLNPTGYGNSPYQGLSAFAGNPMFIDLQQLIKLRLLKADDLSNSSGFPKQKVNFKEVSRFKSKLLKKAFSAFNIKNKSPLKKEFENYKDSNQPWLEDYCLYMAIRENYQLGNWKNWPNPLRYREPQSILFFEELHSVEVEFHAFQQFIFHLQWQNLLKYSHNKGIHFIGDIPIFVGYDCADVWAHPEIFKLNDHLEPVVVAGVPPDYFSPNGQLWGNPLYDWEKQQEDRYHWWAARIKETLKYVDIIRLDHFRGFAGYYQISSDAKTAVEGKWVEGPGLKFFDAIKSDLGYLPFIAEDLGIITPDVIDLRDRLELPGMKILQFAFSGNATNEYLPHNYSENCVAYTGTHDNPTSFGWYENSASENERTFLRQYLGKTTENIPHAMMRAIWSSVAKLVIAPMQDILALRANARMNTPATTEGNWQWRMKPGGFTDEIITWLREINTVYNRFAHS